MITERLGELVRAALTRAVRDGIIGSEPPPVSFERPRRREHGDWATNVALSVAGEDNPRSIAEAIVDRLPRSDLVDRVDVAGPGFLNFHLSPAWLNDVVRRAADDSAGFGRSDAGAGVEVNVEFVSSNPTGPINVASGRHAAVGDAVANLLEATGHSVTREFYINDTGRQMQLFAESVAARYLQIFGIDAQIPEGGYRGDYLADIAARICAEKGDSLIQASSADRASAILDSALDEMLDQMRGSLERFGTRFDVWSSQRKLISGAVDEVIGKLRELGFVEEREGAQFFTAMKFGDDKDRVVVRSNGEPTYLASDAAYVADKFARGFDRLIYLWGADHHGTVARLFAVVEALGFDRQNVEIRLVQMVTISGEKGSKRAGVVVALDDLIDEVGADAARYTFLTRNIDAPLDFDIDLVKEQAPENPVYYVQYAHARICSILRKAAAQGIRFEGREAPLKVLGHPSEETLMRKLASYEEVVVQAAELRAPQRISRYVDDLASDFSSFYRDCRVIGEAADVEAARLTLCVATKNVIADGLGMLGVSAPERM